MDYMQRLNQTLNDNNEKAKHYGDYFAWVNRTKKTKWLLAPRGRASGRLIALQWRKDIAAKMEECKK